MKTQEKQSRAYKRLLTKIKGKPMLKAWVDRNMLRTLALIDDALDERDAVGLDPFLPLLLRPVLLAYGVDLNPDPRAGGLYEFIPNPPSVMRDGTGYGILDLGDRDWSITSPHRYKGLAVDLKVVAHAVADTVVPQGKLSLDEAKQAMREIGILSRKAGLTSTPAQNIAVECFTRGPCVVFTPSTAVDLLTAFRDGSTEENLRPGVPGVIEEKQPNLRSYAEYLAYMEGKYKEYGGRNQYLSSPEYKVFLEENQTKIDLLINAQREARKDKIAGRMSSQGVVVGDRVCATLRGLGGSIAGQLCGVIEATKATKSGYRIRLDLPNELGKKFIPYEGGSGWYKVAPDTQSKTRANSPRANPLLSWQNEFKGKQGAAHYYFGPMLRQDAKEKFSKGLDHVDRLALERGLPSLRLSFMIAPNNYRSEEFYKRASEEAKKRKSVVLIDFVHPPLQGSKVKPGDPLRETPHTFFNAFHRLSELLLGDFSYNIDDQTWHNDPFARLYAKNFRGNIQPFSFCNPQLLAEYEAAARKVNDCRDLLVKESRGALDYRQANACLFSSGVDTAAGRLGALDNDLQVVADVFAKFCVSKDGWIVNPDVLLCENLLPSDVVEQVKSVRSRWAKYLALLVVNKYYTFATFIHKYYNIQDEVYKKARGARDRKGGGEKIADYLKRRFDSMRRDTTRYTPSWAVADAADYAKAFGRVLPTQSVEDQSDYFLRRAYWPYLPGSDGYANRMTQLLSEQPVTRHTDIGFRKKYRSDDDDNTDENRGAEGDKTDDGLGFYRVSVGSTRISKNLPGLYVEYVNAEEEGTFTDEQLQGPRTP